MTTVPHPRALTVVLAWIAGAMVGTGLLLYLLNPMAGLATLILMLGVLSMLLSPIAHVFLMRAQVRKGKYDPWQISVYLVFGHIAVFALLAFTGLFNFT